MRKPKKPEGSDADTTLADTKLAEPQCCLQNYWAIKSSAANTLLASPSHTQNCKIPPSPDDSCHTDTTLGYW